MKLLYLHGPPAAGKLTTARAVLRRVDGRLFDNHSAIDVARNVFDFGAPGFWELVREIRMSVISAAAVRGVPLLVMTAAFVDPDDMMAFERMEAMVEHHGGRVLPVYLKCPAEELARRVGNPDRVDRRKMTSEQSVREFVGKHRVVAVPRSTCLELDSAAGTAEDNASRICDHFQLALARQPS